MSGYTSIAGHYCGQTQPHPAHTWETPPVHGSASLISTYQCGGLATAVRVDTADAMIEAPCMKSYVSQPHDSHDWQYGHTVHGLEWRHCPGREFVV